MYVHICIHWIEIYRSWDDLIWSHFCFYSHLIFLCVNVYVCVSFYHYKREIQTYSLSPNCYRRNTTMPSMTWWWEAPAPVMGMPHAAFHCLTWRTSLVWCMAAASALTTPRDSTVRAVRTSTMTCHGGRLLGRSPMLARVRNVVLRLSGVPVTVVVEGSSVLYYVVDL